MSNKIYTNKNQLLIFSTAAALGGLLFGFDTGVISGAIHFIKIEFNLNAYQEGFAVSNLMIACVIGALLAGPIADWTGRKKVLILCAVLFTVSAILSALPRSFTELVIARFIGGMGVGMASVVSPMYIAEISPAKIRGRLVALNQLAIVVGILLSYFSNWVLVDTGINNWRYMLVAEILPAITFLVGLFFIPESPRWLTKEGLEKEALDVLNVVAGAANADHELQEFKRITPPIITACTDSGYTFFTICPYYRNRYNYLLWSNHFSRIRFQNRFRIAGLSNDRHNKSDFYLCWHGNG